MSRLSVSAQQLPTHQEFIRRLHEDLANESRALIVYIVYSQLIQGGEHEEGSGDLQHALRIARQIDGIRPETTATSPADGSEITLGDRPVPAAPIELKSLAHYQRRIRQAESLGATTLSDALQDLVVYEHTKDDMQRPLQRR